MLEDNPPYIHVANGGSSQMHRLPMFTPLSQAARLLIFNRHTLVSPVAFASERDTVNTGCAHLMVTLFLQTGNVGLVIRISAECEDHPEWTLKDQR